MASVERHRQRPVHRRDHNPSFSSTLLDTIYRSIDNDDDMAEKKLHVRRKSTADFDRKSRTTTTTTTLLNSSSSGSSDSGSTAWLSSSESSSSFSRKPAKPKPARESCSDHELNRKQQREFEGGFVKTKSRGLKGIYGELKKVNKQPVSPGGRLASFLNSIFTNAKKAKTDSSACSSASSFSRSCLSRTPASSSCSRGQNAKRSVRFCPVSVIVDEDCRPCGHKNLHGDTSGPEQARSRRASEEKRRVQEAARDLLKTYRHIQNETLDFLGHDDDDDDASCASSDLFELDNLSTIGEELPVYETTHLGMNRAIANGLIV